MGVAVPRLDLVFFDLAAPPAFLAPVDLPTAKLRPVEDFAGPGDFASFDVAALRPVPALPPRADLPTADVRPVDSLLLPVDLRPFVDLRTGEGTAPGNSALLLEALAADASLDG